jgi:catechol 2,3-dioxygenase-like lactoylglutathione lyase family enzyme
MSQFYNTRYIGIFIFAGNMCNDHKQTRNSAINRGILNAKILGASTVLLMIATQSNYAQTSDNFKTMKIAFVTPTTVGVRYIVDDVDACITFYTNILGFDVVMHPAPAFAMLSKGNLHILLNKPGAGGAGQAMPDGTLPAPGGWNRIQLEVADIESVVAELKKKNVKFRNELVIGNGGKQILLMDPSGNLIELFEPKR